MSFSRTPNPESRVPFFARRRDFIKLAAAFLANHFLPHRVFARNGLDYKKPDRRAIVVTFGGGARYQDTFAPEGWPNIPHLVSDLAPKGILYPQAFNQGLTGHFNSSAALITGSWQYVDSFGSEPPSTPTLFEYLRTERKLPPEETWVIATNKSFSLIGGSKRRGYGDPVAAKLRLLQHAVRE